MTVFVMYFNVSKYEDAPLGIKCSVDAIYKCPQAVSGTLILIMLPYVMEFGPPIDQDLSMLNKTDSCFSS